MIKKIISLLFLFCFFLSPIVEARPQTSRKKVSREVAGVKKRAVPRNRQKKAVAPRKRSPRIARAKARPQRISQGRGRVQRAAAKSRRQSRNAASRSARQSNTRSRRQSVQRPLPIPAPIPVPPAPLTAYLSQLKLFTQRNAERGGLDKLFLKEFKGQGRIVAAIEQSGTWKTLRDLNNNPFNTLSPERKANYKNNFLPAIGGGTLHPEEKNNWILVTDEGSYHGAAVSSVLLDLAPQTKVLPVSTYNMPGSPDKYDVADALMDLSQRSDVNIINISAGHVDFTVTSQAMRDENGLLLGYESKTVYTPKLVEAFKAISQAGKVVVLGSGNEGYNVQPPQFKQNNSGEPRSQIMGHLMEALDPETRQSVILAGAFDPETCVASDYSNKPGNWPEAQERFLFAPGKHMLSYCDFTVVGTSFAAPYICAALANLCSKPGVTPKRAVKALLETADQRSEKQIYGRGLVRADVALERIDAGYY